MKTIDQTNESLIDIEAVATRFDNDEIRAWVESCSVPAVGPLLTLEELVALHGDG